jgi:hypothetical protein
MPGSLNGERLYGGKAFFFEKKKQKTFGPCRVLVLKVRDSAHKSFLVLFFKKELSSLH